MSTGPMLGVTSSCLCKSLEGAGLVSEADALPGRDGKAQAFNSLVRAATVVKL
jgi:hypothetical protein